MCVCLCVSVCVYSQKLLEAQHLLEDATTQANILKMLPDEKTQEVSETGKATLRRKDYTVCSGRMGG